MRRSRSLWVWHAVWLFGLLAAAGMWLTYRWLPADGATGDLNSFTPRGFVVQWLLDPRPRAGGLQVGDVIVRAGGHTVDEWLAGAPRGPEWRAGGTVVYQVVRHERLVAVHVDLKPLSLGAVVARWISQFLVGLAFLGVGLLVFFRHPTELANRLMMLFCVSMAVQYVGDAFNFQYGAVVWRWPLWLQLGYEHFFHSLSIATAVHFTLVFPHPHPILAHHSRLVPAALYLSFPVVIGLAMALAPDWSRALYRGNQVTWAVVLVQGVVAVAATVRSLRTARDPVTRAQLRWIVWGIGVAGAILTPGYAIPLLFGRPALIAHPVLMILIALVPITLAIAILRHRLFDIDLLMNATLVYGVLGGIVAVLYLLFVRALGAAVPTPLRPEQQSVILFLAALGGGLAFEPLRRYVQLAIDRAFYRTKLDVQRLLLDVNERMATSLASDQLSALLTEELPDRLHITWAALEIVDPQQKCLANPLDRCPALPLDHPLIAYLDSYRRPVMRLQPPPRLPADALGVLDRRGIELSVPLVVRDELVGVYNLGSKRSGDAYRSDELHLLHLLGQQAGVAVENSRLLSETERQAKEMAAAEERQKLARDLHDVVSQTLFSASLIADVLPAVWDRDASEGRRLLSELRGLTDGAQAEMRTLLVELRPQALVGSKLDMLLGNLARAMAGRSGVAIDVQVEGACHPLPPDVQVALYRIAQEALNNVVKHARAGRAVVSLTWLAGDVELRVDDDGRGFDPQAVPPGRLGLSIMRERARGIGADLTVCSDPGDGTCVAVAWRHG